MGSQLVLGIDAGGTHTDAVLLDLGEAPLQLLAASKVMTCHEDLASSVSEAVNALARQLGSQASLLRQVARVTIGTTLEINALLQGRAQQVGLALSAGPGLRPDLFAIGTHVCLVGGGLDHRGVEVSPLNLGALAVAARNWPEEGVGAIACVGKFSPRNPGHELAMAAVASQASGLPVCMGHSLSGQLNFPRRIATSYFNAAVKKLHASFLDAVELALTRAGISAAGFLLKADGGSVPFARSRRTPVQSILSGPAASAMGTLALCQPLAQQCTMLMDMGGTTTDFALFVDGLPVLDRDGMHLEGRRTLVRSLACTSIGVGGDSRLVVEGSGENCEVRTGPLRIGPAMAFGGAVPTLLDALNTLDGIQATDRGDVRASQAGLAELALRCGMAGQAKELAAKAVENALDQIECAAQKLLAEVNERPIYTLSALKAARSVSPAQICLVGGPAPAMRERIADRMGLPVHEPNHAAVANAIGAALTLPTAGLELYADTGAALLRVPALELEEPIGRGYGLEDARQRARELLAEHMLKAGYGENPIDIVGADMFATLDDAGYGSRDMRVSVQTRPGLAGKFF